jgi:hypothetical protein
MSWNSLLLFSYSINFFSHTDSRKEHPDDPELEDGYPNGILL